MSRISLLGRWSDYQLSRLELVFAIIVILVLLSIFLNRMIIMLAHAERSMIETSIVNMNTALRLYALHAQMRSDYQALSAMQHANPVELLNKQPEWGMAGQLESDQMATVVKARMSGRLTNYAGEMSEADAVDLTAGSWYFDTGKRILVYRIRNVEVFRSDLPGPPSIRYVTNLDYQDIDGDGKFSPDIDQFRNISLRPLEDFQWLF